MTDIYTLIAEISEIAPGKMICRALQDRRILLANVDGEILASDEMCTHEDASLCDGALNGEWLRCPLHGSRFNLRSGAVMDEPAEDDLRTYAVQIRDGRVYVRFD